MTTREKRERKLTRRWLLLMPLLAMGAVALLALVSCSANSYSTNGATTTAVDMQYASPFEVEQQLEQLGYHPGQPAAVQLWIKPGEPVISVQTAQCVSFCAYYVEFRPTAWRCIPSAKLPVAETLERSKRMVSSVEAGRAAVFTQEDSTGTKRQYADPTIDIRCWGPQVA